MGSNSWLKLYHEVLNDPKMGTMSDHLYRRTIEIFLLAGQEGRDGLLPPVPQIAWALRTTVADVTRVLHDLTELGIINVTGETYNVTHFADRQNTNLSGAERVAKLREKRSESYNSNTDNVTGVTQDVTEECYTCTENVTVDKDKEEDKDKELIKERVKERETATATPQKRKRGVLHPYGIGQNVWLSDQEYANLIKTLGDRADPLIENLSVYMGKNPNYSRKGHNEDHYFVLLSWAKSDERKAKAEEAAAQKQQAGQSAARKQLTAYEMLQEMGEA